jgi:hypothetical protein
MDGTPLSELTDSVLVARAKKGDSDDIYLSDWEKRRMRRILLRRFSFERSKPSADTENADGSFRLSSTGWRKIC